MAPETRTMRALVVDDDVSTREFVGSVLASVNCEVYYAINGDDALVQAWQSKADVVYLDVELPRQDGWLVCAKLKVVEPAPAVILMTGATRGDLFEFAEFVAADDVLRKPFS